MVRTRAVFLDTHVVVWIVAGEAEKIRKEARDIIDSADLFISPTVSLELQFLHEIGRITATAAEALAGLQHAIGLHVATDSFVDVVQAALAESWTRDPFDRLIVAHARMLGATLISRDRRIADAYVNTQW